MTETPLLKPVSVPSDYDYVAIYLTDRCPLRCSYCITEHNDTRFISGTDTIHRLKPAQWIAGLNRLRLPKGVPVTLQGGEPFVYHGVWELLDGLEQDVDILTALPKGVTPEKFSKLKSINRLKRDAPYPTIRVSYHPGQNKLEELVPRILELQKVVNIGLYAVDHPDSQSEIVRAKEMCEKAGVFFRTKEFLGFHDGKLHGTYKYDDAVAGRVTRPLVQCRNSVLIVAPDGSSYRCHSDLYHKRKELTQGNLMDAELAVRGEFQDCRAFGLCSECDIKVKNNHEQVFGYTSVAIRFPGNPDSKETKEAPSPKNSFSGAAGPLSGP